ncbi:hypothetical protein [Chelativorans sp. AA-79]|uniref:hypothetical protein n=1 Tax=Chelativorans sp. AA-79 TaxID=3028735 RepID=UPI0023F6D4A1|nr:hypothetical protein [Chelativorans sp. AA-79]WEX10262.1 hypothetical protein PVE73_04695 [Chelativorans sp. AA-79]
MSRYDENFQAALPRSESMEGDDLMIAAVTPEGAVVITDGERSAHYVPHQAEALKGTKLRIVPKYVEAGWFSEANVVTLTDGAREALYVPARQTPTA